MRRFVGMIQQAGGNSAKQKYQAFTLNRSSSSPIFQTLQKAVDWLEKKVGIPSLELDGSGLKRGWVGYRVFTRQPKPRKDRLPHDSGIRFRIGSSPAEVMVGGKFIPMDEAVASNVITMMKKGLPVGPNPVSDQEVL